MKLKLFRFSKASDSTLGLLHINGIFGAMTLEDPVRDIKVPKKTAIPAGTYPVEYRKEPTPMTMSYRAKYDFFNFHLWIKNVPRFEYVYLHIGNDTDDTDGCILVGDQLTYSAEDNEFLGHSTRAFKRVYTKICAALDRGEEVTLQIVELEG